MDISNDRLTASVAQLWCLPQHAHKEMDADFAMSIIALLQQVRDAAKKEDIEILKEQFAAAKCKSCKMSFFKAENRIKWSVTAIRQVDGGK